ncbi:MAG TPA: hypothetical protein DCZ92_11585 [Elusimicrobia bacterium]|nr:MAG: hypothetical protein A2016_07595 [Elusimicrobia bacterium GWF2_62_30]HBA61434.1 hypothetical protein [Elusimicrobiota bacterium]
MFRILPEGRSRTLSLLALGLAAVSGCMAALTIGRLFLFVGMSASPSFWMGMASTTVPVEMPALAAFAAEHILIFFVVFALLWLSAFVLALGVWRRREWARGGAAAMLYLLSAAAFLVMLFPSLVVPRPLFYQGVSIAPEFNQVVTRMAQLLRIVSLCGGALLLWWGLALDRGRLRLEFERGKNEKDQIHGS